MKEIQFNKRKYNVPESWSEVTLRMVIRTQKNVDILPNQDLICIVSGYVGIPIEELKESKLAQVNKIVQTLSFLYKEYKPRINHEFEFRGKTYGMALDIKDIRFEDYISAQTILHNHRDNPVEGLPRLVATLCKLPKETLDDFDMDVRAEEFLDLEWVKVKDVETFFLRALRAYEAFSQLCLPDSQMQELIQTQLSELKLTMKQYVARNGGTWLTRFRIMYYRVYLKYLKRELGRYFNSIASSPSETSSTET